MAKNSRPTGRIGAERRSTTRFLARVLPGAEPMAIPGFIPPCRPSSRKTPPSGSGWVHEIRFDGLRIQGQLQDGRPTLFAGDGSNRSSRFARIAAALGRLPVNGIVLDGVVIVQDAAGRSDRAALEAELAAGRQERLVAYAFDLLHLDGFDIRAAPLAERKRVLAALLAEAGEGPIAYSEHLEVDGKAMLARIREMGLGGIVSKRADAPYRSGQQESWVDVVCAPGRGPRAERRTTAGGGRSRGGAAEETVTKAPGDASPGTRQGSRSSSNGGNPSPPLLVIDGDSFAHRAYHALPKSIRRAGDRGGGAIVGFANYLLRLYQDERPRAVLVGWDTLDVPTWRHEAFAAYQSGRQFDHELLDQLNVLPEFVGACGFANAKAAGYEADDFLAAAVAAEERRGGRAVVASGDRDAFQLASSSTTILQPVRAGVMTRIGPGEVRERYGVEPQQVPDFIALRGDPSDKLPGARGVGAQRAAALLGKYGSLEEILADGYFHQQADALRLYRRIATMDAAAPLPALPDQTPDWASAARLARDWSLNALAKRLEELAGSRP